MPRAEQHVLIQAPIERVFAIITDYAQYPAFLPELKAAQLLSREDGVALVKFEVELIMRVQYTLRLIEDAPTSVTWSLHQGKMMVVNNGHWRLEKVDEGTTRTHYGLEVKLGGMIPTSVSTRLMGSDLPRMLERFKQRAEDMQVTTGVTHASGVGKGA